MAVTATSASSASAALAAAAAATGSKGNQPSLAKNFDTFLQMLTTQLKNQNPLDPLDTNQFTQQLVQFAQVEQQINMNQSLNSLIGLQGATQALSVVSFLGTTATFDGNTARLANGQASWTLTSSKAASATINVKSSTGEVVYSESRTLTAGTQTFNWNGRGSNGTALPSGDYTISITANDASGQAVSVSTEVTGVIDGVDMTTVPPLLKIGSRTVALDKIKQVRRPGA